MDAHAGRPARSRVRRQLSEEGADHVRELIMSGQLTPGEVLRPERFAEELGISVTPIREGLLALRAEGFIAQEPRRGFVVLPLTRQDVLDVFLVQAALAGELAERATRELTDSDLAELKAVHERMVDAADANEVEEQSFRFHQIINQAADSPKLSWFMRTAVRYAPRRYYSAVPDWIAISVLEHEEILAALTSGNAREARARMHTHILHSGRLLADHLDAAD